VVPAGGSTRIRSSPLVRRIAKDNNLDLGQITGSGSAGRITKEDVLRQLSAQRSASAATPTVGDDGAANSFGCIGPAPRAARTPEMKRKLKEAGYWRAGDEPD